MLSQTIPYFMQVTAAPVSNNHEKVLFPALTAILGLILSPLKGIIISNSLLHVAIEIVHKLRINCGMTLGAWMRGVIRLFKENPAAVPVDLFHVVHCCCCWSHTLLASRHVLACLCIVYFPGFFSSTHLGCDSGFCRRSSICRSCLCCFQHQN
jgi:hypothetical protein